MLITNNYFESPFRGIPLAEQVTNPNIIVGRYSYYSGYYHGHSFEDCVRYLMPDRKDVDKLIIGSFCSIGTGVSFIPKQLQDLVFDKEKGPGIQRS